VFDGGGFVVGFDDGVGVGFAISADEEGVTLSLERIGGIKRMFFI